MKRRNELLPIHWDQHLINNLDLEKFFFDILREINQHSLQLLFGMSQGEEK
jgi:hypothetical protein